MISRYIALLLSLALAGCCASGVGCGTVAAPTGAVAWDGLGAAPPENAAGGDIAPTERKRVRQTAARATNKPSGDQWEQDQVSDQNADAKLNSQLKICSNC
jgi:hypothetical protein